MTDQTPYKFGKHFNWVLKIIIFVAIAQCFGEALGNIYRYILKPIPIALLIFSLAQSIYQNKNIRSQHMSKWVLAGLIFSIVGDILLMIKTKDIFFYAGTGFFLTAHLLYIWSFRQGEPYRQPSKLKKIIINGITFAMIAIYVSTQIYLWNDLPIKSLYLIYGGVISCLTIFAVRRYRRTNQRSYIYVAIGAIFFTTSDSLIAYFQFQDKENLFGNVIIMLLYYWAQLFLTVGTIFHDNPTCNILWCEVTTSGYQNITDVTRQGDKNSQKASTISLQQGEYQNNQQG